MKSRILGLACLFLPAVLSGCGPSHPGIVPVSGVVTYQGKPVEGAQVTFMAPNAARAAFAVTDADGKFRLTTFDTNDGAVVGVHTVTISKPTKPAGGESMSPDSPDAGYAAAMAAAAAGPATVESVLPEKYANPETSGLTREVVAEGSNEFTIDLE